MRIPRNAWFASLLILAGVYGYACGKSSEGDSNTPGNGSGGSGADSGGGASGNAAVSGGGGSAASGGSGGELCGTLPEHRRGQPPRVLDRG